MSPYDLDQADFLFSCDGLAGEQLFVSSLTGHEEIAQPFHYLVELVSPSPNVDIDAPIGQPAELTLRGHLPHGGVRYSRRVRGIVERFEQISAGRLASVYQALLVPTITPLKYNRAARIFQNKTTQQILQSILSRQIRSDNIVVDLRTNYEPRGYCVQYHESDFHFVQRLMEHEGIYYYFDIESGHDKIQVIDKKESAPTLPKFSELVHRETMGLAEECISDFRSMRALRPGRVTVNDYRPANPRLNLLTQSQANTFTDLEVFDFPARYHHEKLGKRLADVRLEELQHDQHQFSAQSNCRMLAPGYVFHLANHARAKSNTDYLIVAVECNASQPAALGESASGAGRDKPHFVARLRCIPATVQYRPPRRTARPVVHGVQTAMVVGPKGEEIHCDDLGRVKVQFHWDRDGGRDDNSSCWVRVSQPWGGMGQGGMFIPRIGQEVIVQFLEGDPDRPIIVGRVYNGENPVPHGLPAAKNVSTIRSASTPGGNGFNELRFDDSAGGEQIYIHAQSAMDIEVLGHKTEDVIGSVTEKFHSTQSTTVDSDVTENYLATQKTTVTGDVTEIYQANQTTEVTGNVKETYKAKLETEVTGDTTQKYKANQTITVDGNLKETVTKSVEEIYQNGYKQTIAAGSEYIITGGVTSRVTGNTNETFNGPVKITVTAPYTLTAPSITLDAPEFRKKSPKFFDMGIQKTGIYGFSTSVIGMKTDIVGLKIDLHGLKLHDGKIKVGNLVAEVKATAASIKQIATISMICAMIEIGSRNIELKRSSAAISQAAIHMKV